MLHWCRCRAVVRPLACRHAYLGSIPVSAAVFFFLLRACGILGPSAAQNTDLSSRGAHDAFALLTVASVAEWKCLFYFIKHINSKYTNSQKPSALQMWEPRDRLHTTFHTQYKRHALGVCSRHMQSSHRHWKAKMFPQPFFVLRRYCAAVESAKYLCEYHRGCFKQQWQPWESRVCMSPSAEFRNSWGPLAPCFFPIVTSSVKIYNVQIRNWILDFIECTFPCTQFLFLGWYSYLLHKIYFIPNQVYNAQKITSLFLV